MNRRIAVLATCVLCGCGGEEGQSPSDPATGPLACDELLDSTFTPCGGEVVGTWAVLGCSQLLSPIEILAGTCDGQVGTSALTYRVDGFQVLRPDGTSLYSGAAHVWEVRTYPASCGCDEREREIRDDDATHAVVGYQQCAVEGEVCECTYRELASGPVTNGEYRVEGTRIETAPGVFFDYCRDGNRLTLVSPWLPIAGHDGATTRSRIVLTRLSDPVPPAPTE